jgi:diguanylate cyclase (GGDEF)-like protein
MDEDRGDPAAARRAARNFRRKVIQGVLVFLWAALVVVQGLRMRADPTPITQATFAAFVVLFLAINAQVLIMRWMGHTRWRRTMMRFQGNAYISDLEGLPNRNYLLSELRREMPRARNEAKPFVIVVLSFDELERVRERRGEEFVERAVHGLAEVLKRFTRTSDFIAHLGGDRFCVLLTECTLQDSYIYLKRVPGTIAVSDGRSMYDVPVMARLHQYDLEALYATDVLRDAEDARPMKRKQQVRFDSVAA